MLVYKHTETIDIFYLFIYLHFIYRLFTLYIKTHDLKEQLNCIAVQMIRYMHAN